MNYFMNLVMSGLVIGTLYGMVAMGFAIIYRATGMVNFAQGEVMMLIAYMSYTFATIPGMTFIPLLACVLMASIALGLFIEWAFIRPMLGEPMFSRVDNIRKFVILKKQLDHDDGELTATMKVRRNVIEKKFAAEISEIYGPAKEAA